MLYRLIHLILSLRHTDRNQTQWASNTIRLIEFWIVCGCVILLKVTMRRWLTEIVRSYEYADLLSSWTSVSSCSALMMHHEPIWGWFIIEGAYIEFVIACNCDGSLVEFVMSSSLTLMMRHVAPAATRVPRMNCVTNEQCHEWIVSRMNDSRVNALFCRRWRGWDTYDRVRDILMISWVGDRLRLFHVANDHESLMMHVVFDNMTCPLVIRSFLTQFIRDTRGSFCNTIH